MREFAVFWFFLGCTSPWHVLTAVVAFIDLRLALFDSHIWFSSPAFWQWRNSFSSVHVWFLISSGVKQTSSHLVICTASDLSCLHFLFQVNAVQQFKLPFEKISFVISIFIQHVGFIFLLYTEDNSSSFFFFFFFSFFLRQWQKIQNCGSTSPSVWWVSRLLFKRATFNSKAEKQYWNNRQTSNTFHLHALSLCSRAMLPNKRTKCTCSWKGGGFEWVFADQ